MSTFCLPMRRARGTGLVRRARPAHLAAIGLCALIAAAFGVAASPAGAVVTVVNNQSYGFQPRDDSGVSGQPSARLEYHGGPVMHSNNTYAIYWDPQARYDGDWKSLINRYLGDVAHASGTLGNVFAVASQYTDSANGRAANASTFSGGITDHTAYPTAAGCADAGSTCLTDAQLRSELNNFISLNHLPTGANTLYFLLTPPGVTVCADSGGAGGHCSDTASANSFCSYHSAIGSGGPGTVLYAVQPWTAGSDGMFNSDQFTGTDGRGCQDGSSLQEPNQTGLDMDGDYDVGLADVIINNMSIQQNAAMTNPLFTGWYVPSTKNEQSDMCRNWLRPVLGGTLQAQVNTNAGSLFDQKINGNTYYLNTEFNNAALDSDFPGVACIGGVSVVAQFSIPSAVNVGDVVALDGGESNISLGAVNYHWDFGDGQSSTSGQGGVFHSYATPGSFPITLTVTDRGGNVSTQQQTITVVPPSAAPDASSNGGSSGVPGPSVIGGGLPGLIPPGPGSRPASNVLNPAGLKLSSSIVTKKLSAALRSGLAVRYTVNEEVAGRFEVLLDGRTAHRLKVPGAVAAGFARLARARRPIVIGTATVVTAHGGTNGVSVHFSRATAKRLGREHSLTVTLRLTAVDLAARRSVFTRAGALRG